MTPTEQWVESTRCGDVVTLRLRRGKVNALNLGVIEQAAGALRAAQDDGARALILTGTGSFFSFGFDVPEMVDWPRERFAGFLRGFCGFYRELFLTPTPVVAAVNGHAVAGGCILALCADHRVMARGGAKIALNEITFGASIFAGVVEMLRFHIGGGGASGMLLGGDMMDADEAAAMGLVETVAEAGRVMEEAERVADRLGKNPDAFAALKQMLRGDIGEMMAARDRESIESFLDIWYSPSTRRQLAGIQIR